MKRRKLTLPIIIATAVVLLSGVGIVGAINGWFGGGGTIPSDTMTRGLVGFWNFDEGRATTTNDSSGNNNTGYFATAASSPAWTSGKSGNGSALSFDGSNDYVNIADSANWYFGAGDITYDWWIYPRVLSGIQVFLAQYQSITENMAIYFNDAGFVWEDKTGGSWAGRQLSVASGMSVNNWYHIVVVKRGSNAYLYVNSIEKGSSSFSAGTNFAAPLQIGSQVSGTAFPFNGLIDEVRIYNRALTAAEVRFHYNRGGPVAQWKFDEGSATTTFDSSGNSNTGYFQTAASSPTWTSGKYGSALNFDGVDDYVQAANSSSTSITPAITLEAWVKPSAIHNGGIINKWGHWDNRRQYSFYIDSSGKVVLALSADGIAGTLLTSSSGYSANIWNHLVATWDGITMRLYINGIQDANKASFTSAISTSTIEVRIGERISNIPFNGLIDDVRIYNYARTQDEIALDYNAGFGSRFGPTGATCDVDPGACMTKGLVGFWNMEDRRGTTTADISGNGNTGVFATAASSPAWTNAGKVGGALSFDGDDRVNIPITLSPPYTLTLWGKLNALPSVLVAQEFFTDGSTANTAMFGYDETNRLYFNNGSQIFWGYPSASTILSWRMYTVVVNGANSIIYLDGGTPVTGTLASTSITTLLLGENGNGSVHLTGLMDEVRIYNRALTAAEVRYHYNRGGPVAQWKFDEGSGLTTYDSSGNANTGTLQNNMATTSWTTGKSASALNFDGVNDYVNVPDNATLDITSAITIEAWVKANAFPAYSNIVSKNTNGWEYVMQFVGATPQVGFYDGVAWQTQSGTAINTNEYIHLVYTFDGSNIRVYQNGVLKGTKTGITTAPASAPTKPVLIGANPTLTVPDQYFNGLIDDVRIYNYARTQDQILQDYNAGMVALFGPTGATCDVDPGACMTKGLVGFWNFEDRRGTTTADISGNGNTGIFATAASSPAWTSGKVGGALSFDGTADYVNFGTTLNSYTTSDITVSFWVKIDGTANNSTVLSNVDGVATAGLSLTFNGLTLQVFYNPVDGRYDANPVTIANEWTQIAITYKSNNTILTSYVNGSQFDSDNTKVAVARTVTNMYLGARPDNPGPWRYFNGLIDEVRVYNRALTAAEVRYHYNRGGPIAQWKFDEGSGLTAFDSSGQGNTGTLQNNMATTSWASGKSASALLFDGVNDYVSVADSNALSFVSGTTDQPFTLTAWIKLIDTTSRTIVSKFYSVGDNREYRFFVDEADRLVLSVNNNIGTTWIGRKGSILTSYEGTWIHVVATYDGSEVAAGIDLFLNGKVDDIDDRSSGTYTNMTNGTAPLEIGSREVGTAELMNGLIDDVKIYNYARTQDQILQDYNGGYNVYFK